MLHTNDVADLLKSKAGVMEVTKFTLAVQRSGIENDMIMDVGTVCVSCYQKSVFSFGEPRQPHSSPTVWLPPV